MFNPLILNNPISRWLIAISLFILTFIAGKVVYWVLSRWVKRLTQKTETKLDDIIIDMLEEPFAFAVVLVGARYSLGWLTLPDSIAAWPDDAFQFLLAITIAWFAVRLYDALQQNYLVPLTQGAQSDFYTQFVPVLDTGIRLGGWVAGIAVGFHRANYNIEAIAVTLVIGSVVVFLVARRALIEAVQSTKSFITELVAVQSEKTIHKQVYNAILFLCFISLLVTLFLSYRFYQDQTQREDFALEEAEQDAQAVVDYIDDELAELQSLVDHMANDLTSGALPYDQLANRLRAEANAHPHIYGVGAAFKPYTYKPDVELYSPYFTRNEEGGFERRQVEDSYDYTNPTDPNAAWYTGTMAEGNRWLDPFFAPVPQAWLAPYHAVFYQDGQPAGLIAGIHSLDSLADLIRQLDLGEEGYSFILAQDGTFIAHPEPSFLGTNVYEQAAKFDDTSLIRDAERALAGETFRREGQDLITGQDAWLFYQSVPSAGWVIGVVMDKQIHLSAPNTVKRSLTRIILSLIAFLLFLSALLFHADRGKVFRLWGVSITTAILFTVAITLICYLEVTYPPRENDQVILVNKSSLNDELDQVDQRFEREGLPPPIRIPTGIMIETVTFGSTTENMVTGYIWQKYPLDLPDTIDREIILPDVPDPEGLAVEEMYRFEQGDVEVIGWTFRANLKQQPKVSKYPFDEAKIQIQLWPKSLNKNIVLVPDLDEYQFTNPTQTPGLVEGLVLEDWAVERSFFGYRQDKYNATFGSSQVIKKFNIPDLYYNIVIRRNILSPIVAYAITLSVVIALMFAVMVIHAESSFNVLSYAAALFFVVAVTHVGLRSELNTHNVVYLEHGFIIMYLVLLSVSINSMLFYSNINIPLIQYKNNLIPKLLYWPALQGIMLAITLGVFYPAADPAEAIDALQHGHDSDVAPIAVAPPPDYGTTAER